MTVRAIVPIIEYTGNGVQVKYDWDWDMIEDSIIGVMINNENVFNWNLQDQSVVFDTPPIDGAFIQIYRRTKIWMPEDYLPFGRFHPEKTELSVDRAIMITQERIGKFVNGNVPDGIVGGSDLSITRGEFTVTVESERGTDAVLPMYDPDGIPTPVPGDPDPSIAIWDMEVDEDPLLIGIYSLPGNTSGVSATIRFKMNLDGGDPDEATAEYPNYNAIEYIGWWTNISGPAPGDDEYWMRVRKVIPGYQIENLVVNDGEFDQALDVPFKIRGQVLSPVDALVDRAGNVIVDRFGVDIIPRGVFVSTDTWGPYISLHTFGDLAPIMRTAQVYVDICKDDGTGLPDGAWATRQLNMESRFNG